MAKPAHPKSTHRSASGTALSTREPKALASRDAGSGASPSSGVGALVASQLADMTPSFGNILASIGLGVARSQAALDEGVIETVKQLADTKITVVTEVIEQLDDDGLPDVATTQLITNELSVLNFVAPTVHEWQHVSLSMDMSVGAMDEETGASFSLTQNHSGNTRGALTGLVGVGAMSTNSSVLSMQLNAEREAQWSNGTVQLDAVLAPRRTGKFPVPAQVTIGPQLFISQGAVTETKTAGVLTERSVELMISVRKASGAVNPDKELSLDAGGLLPSFSSDDPFTGSTTNADGQCSVSLRRPITPGFAQPARRSITLRLGEITKRFDLVI
ncbi:hypothetical protein [Roseateles albus]|uniref:Uncharacterized protein n=1 Tax=Roseateles albus TaxID=2987525 RepID=A0ABT5K975_9BURK|nr:hypothetical protein [Roseateles albus]MDC8770502.1 hypothetical protein [Roseateles albus]